MTIDPVHIANEIKRTYALNLVGRHPTAFKNLLSRFEGAGDTIEEKLPELVQMRGPYLQALGIPAWSERSWQEFASSVSASYAPAGLFPEIVETFSEVGFDRLYEFQEEGIRAVLNDRNTLVVAATGRGKTESWMIPLFQYIIARKRGIVRDETPASGVKALLIYPTKALAQDQLKRLMRYLFRLNRKLEPAARISIGIFDGDTPSVMSPDVRTYLYDAFKHFRCPIYDPELTRCEGCTRNLVPMHRDAPGARLKLNLPEPACRDKVELGFIELTREDIVERRPDIVLTNPDTLNIRLLNINESDQRTVFIEDPKFVVLDEVHTYTELFGAFTAFILKRLRQERARLHSLRSGVTERVEDDRFRLIAASATVANKEQLFSKLGGLSVEATEVVQESPGSLPEGEIGQIPLFLTEYRLEESGIEPSIRALSAGRSPARPYAELLEPFDLDLRTLRAAKGEEGREEIASEAMFARLTDRADARSPLQVLRYLHHSLSRHPMTPADLEDKLIEDFPHLTAEAVDNLIHNFSVIGAYSGVLENRVHLFTWPLDGFYTCLHCGRVYREPREACRCSGQFVTKLVLCNHCGQEALESWFCPYCHRLYPLSATVGGETVYYGGYECNCTGEPHATIRVIWRPYYRCTQCGHVARIDTAPSCEDCGAALVHRNDGLQCVNPTCRRRYAVDDHNECTHCEGSLSSAASISYMCHSCGTAVEIARPGARCECGGALTPFTSLPWVCADPECGRVSFADEPPPQCECGKRLHGLGALFDLSSAEYCPECDKYYLINHSCGVEGHSVAVRPMDFRSFNVIDNGWQVRPASDLRGVVPCYHPYIGYSKNSRYETLMRSPANVAVTSAQYGLRSVVGNTVVERLPERLSQAKMLSFSDSHSDMEQLARDFDEPEQRVFIDQLITAELEQGDQTLADLIKHVTAKIDTYGEWLNEAADQGVKPFSWIRHYGGTETIADEVRMRFLRGFYSWRRSYRPGLVADGIADIRLRSSTLDERERAVIAELTRFDGQRRSNLQDAVGDEVSEFGSVLEELQRKGLIQTELKSDYICLEPEALICSLVGPDRPIGWEPTRERFFATLQSQLETAPFNLMAFNVPSHERSDFSHPNFSRAAFRVHYSRPLILRSEVYKGDVKKKKRREIEYAFKFGNSVHFLSSGPTMELGIDIGDLDLLLLYGTPPNINAYLQRVGRGGRRSKRSLVVSVSKRNPIDYYYYRRPTELISSSPQPVPLNEHNEEVMRISLTWALLDFIATCYWVPWQKEARPTGDTITDGQAFYTLLDPAPDQVISYTKLVFYFSNQTTEYGYPLRALSVILSDRQDEARAYLRRLLDFPVCPQCGTHGEAIGDICPLEKCGARLVGAHTLYDDLIEEVISHFDDHMVNFLENFRDELYQEQDALAEERSGLRRQLRRLSRHRREERHKIERRQETLSARIRGIEQALQDLDGMSYTDTQQYTRESKYAYQIRSVSDVVEVTAHTIDRSGRTVSDSQEPRGMDMAIRDYHPYAIVLKGGQEFVTCRVDFDQWKTQELIDRLESAGMSHQHLACQACGGIYDDLEPTTCSCGARLSVLEIRVIRRAHIYPLSFRLGADPERPGASLLVKRAFRFGAEEKPKSTFTATESQVCRFEPSERLTILSEDGRRLGDLERGRLEIVTFANSASVSYESGLREPWPQFFEICGVEDCNGVLVRGEATKFCAFDPTHDITQRRIVRPAYLFETQGLRLRLDHSGAVVTHSLAHGLRLALEKIGGVLVRSIGELMEDDVAYVYDTTPGGSGVTRLLTQRSGDTYPYFSDALDTIDVVVGECRCDDGCPHCLYQYGCCYWNSPRTLSRRALLTLLREGLRLGAATEPQSSNTPSLPEHKGSVWVTAEANPREATWSSICQLEARLRQLIQTRYKARHGEEWLEDIDSALRERWARASDKDERAFGQYARSESSPLDYSYLSDLLALINKEWDLFHDVFGKGKAVKRQLQGKIEDIVRVRNPLAHNRAVPQNELKRAEVYCTDILMQLHWIDQPADRET